MRVVGCFLEYQGKFVMLYRHSHKSNGATWGPPSGKVEPGETDDEAMLRELYEETGYQATPAELEQLGTFDCTAPSGVTNPWIVYRIRLTRPHAVVLEEAAHEQYTWVTPEECNALPDVIYGVKDVLHTIGYLT